MADRDAVEESDDIRIIDPAKLDQQAVVVKKAEDLARRAKIANDKLQKANREADAEAADADDNANRKRKNRTAIADAEAADEANREKEKMRKDSEASTTVLPLSKKDDDEDYSDYMDLLNLDQQKRIVEESEDLARRAKIANDQILANQIAPVSRDHSKLDDSREVPKGGEMPEGTGTPQSEWEFRLKNMQDNLDDFKKTQMEIESSVEEVNSIISQGSDIISDPASFIQGMFKRLPFVLTLFGSIGVVTVLVGVIHEAVKKLFSKGHALDISKKIRDEVSSIPELRILIDSKQGRIYWTADTTVRQRAPAHSTSERLRDGDDFYRHINIGRVTGGYKYP